MNRSSGPSSSSPFSNPGSSRTSSPSSRSSAAPSPVFLAKPTVWSGTDTALPDGFEGKLSLGGPELLNAEEAGDTLTRLAALICWAQAQQAQVVARIETLFARDIADASGREDPGWAQSLAAAEVGALLRLPHMSALRLVNESHSLTSEHLLTLGRLSEGKISYQHTRAVLEEVQSVPDVPSQQPDPHSDEGLEPGADPDQGPDDGEGTCHRGVRARFEVDLLGHAEGLTAARFTAKARRLRESLFPETIQVRHREALSRRRVCFEPLPDGMSCVSAFLAAEKGQALYTALSAAARGEKTAGDTRTMDQLRADILGSALLGEGFVTNGKDQTAVTGPSRWTRAPQEPSETGGERRETPIGRPQVPDGGAPRDAEQGARRGTRHGAPRNAGRGSPLEGERGAAPDAGRRAPRDAEQGAPLGRTGTNRGRARKRNGIKTEVMVLINADTLVGLNDAPAELNGYGPLSPETGRRMVQEALSWTPLAQDPRTGEILAVGRRRRIPSGLKRWLQARDGTCRFPGCGVNVRAAQIDHTLPWAQGGATDHSNLEHLCPKHHRFKTLGHWRARQPEAGTIEWTSPVGRTYRTGPILAYTEQDFSAQPVAAFTATSNDEVSSDERPPDEPPPF
ncbi:DUF222 domain-containing protein [Arthrobacter sp. Sa2CUA1]|uniref:DUF222 domain-containing protein n=1 Tax=Arthrobacter gallicola TaxID=2762225 RepID=A0ABR8UPM3_9MICC|nr:DUF222 domain-containing protein [Arthrobacter gallicola]